MTVDNLLEQLLVELERFQLLFCFLTGLINPMLLTQAYCIARADLFNVLAFLHHTVSL